MTCPRSTDSNACSIIPNIFGNVNCRERCIVVCKKFHRVVMGKDHENQYALSPRVLPQQHSQPRAGPTTPRYSICCCNSEISQLLGAHVIWTATNKVEWRNAVKSFESVEAWHGVIAHKGLVWQSLFTVHRSSPRD